MTNAIAVDDLSSSEVLIRLNGRISYRRLDHMVRTGKITPSVVAGSGTGIGRRWSHLDVIVLERIITMLERHTDEATRLASGAMWDELHQGLHAVG